MIGKKDYHEMEINHMDLLDAMILVSKDFCKGKPHNFLEECLKYKTSYIVS